MGAKTHWIREWFLKQNNHRNRRKCQKHGHWWADTPVTASLWVKPLGGEWSHPQHTEDVPICMRCGEWERVPEVRVNLRNLLHDGMSNAVWIQGRGFERGATVQGVTLEQKAARDD